MAKQLDKIVVVDVESTCWQSKIPSGMHNEIIEVGVCLLDLETGGRDDAWNIAKILWTLIGECRNNRAE